MAEIEWVASQTGQPAAADGLRERGADQGLHWVRGGCHGTEALKRLKKKNLEHNNEEQEWLRAQTHMILNTCQALFQTRYIG